MNKKIIVGILMSLIFSGVALGQTFPTDPETKKVFFQETVILDGYSQKDLHERSKAWLQKNFIGNKDFSEDLDNGKIIKKAYFPVIITVDYKYKNEHTVLFNWTLQHKEGKYRYTITDFTVYETKNGERTAQPLEAFFAKLRHQNKTEFHNNFNNELNNLLEALKKYCETGEIKDEDDW